MFVLSDCHTEYNQDGDMYRRSLIFWRPMFKLSLIKTCECFDNWECHQSISSQNKPSGQLNVWYHDVGAFTWHKHQTLTMIYLRNVPYRWTFSQDQCATNRLEIIKSVILNQTLNKYKIWEHWELIEICQQFYFCCW